MIIGGFPKKNIYLLKNPKKKKKILLNGRSSLAMILKFLKVKKILIPFYICNSIINVLENLKISYEFYPIDQSLKPIINKKKREISTLVVPFFGIVKIKHQKNFIYDLSNSFFYKKKSNSLYFDSIRKFFNVNFGSNLTQKCFFKDSKKEINLNFDVPKNLKTFRSNEDKHFIYYKDVSDKIYTEYYHLNFSKIKKKREVNFKIYHKFLKNMNFLEINLKEVNGPLYYPFLIENGLNLKKKLNNQKIFNPILWQEILLRKNLDKFPFEKNLVKNLVLLPISETIILKNIKKIVSFIYKNI